MDAKKMPKGNLKMAALARAAKKQGRSGTNDLHSSDSNLSRSEDEDMSDNGNDQKKGGRSRRGQQLSGGADWVPVKYMSLLFLHT